MLARAYFRYGHGAPQVQSPASLVEQVEWLEKVLYPPDFDFVAGFDMEVTLPRHLFSVVDFVRVAKFCSGDDDDDGDDEDDDDDDGDGD